MTQSCVRDIYVLQLIQDSLELFFRTVFFKFNLNCYKAQLESIITVKCGKCGKSPLISANAPYSKWMERNFRKLAKIDGSNVSFVQLQKTTWWIFDVKLLIISSLSTLPLHFKDRLCQTHFSTFVALALFQPVHLRLSNSSTCVEAITVWFFCVGKFSLQHNSIELD